MGLFSKRQSKNSNVDSKLEQPYTGGNQWQTNERLRIQEQVDINTISKTLADTQNGNVTDNIKDIVLKNFEGKEYVDWYLLNFQANYFTNTIKFDCSDYKLTQQIYNVIKCAFLTGKAGIYFDTINLVDGMSYTKPRSVYIRKIEYDIYNEIKSVEISSVSNGFFDSEPDYESLVYEKLEGDKVNNLVLFQWGNLALGAYFLMYPFVKIQNQLLHTLLIEASFYNKKWVYKLANKANATSEVEAFFDYHSPLIIEMMGKSISNKFEPIDLSGAVNSSSNFIDFYHNVCHIYYELFGRSIGTVQKHERNLDTEAQSLQDQTNAIQYEYKKYFDIFLRQLQTHEYLLKNGITVDYELKGDSNESESDNIQYN